MRLFVLEDDQQVLSDLQELLKGVAGIDYAVAQSRDSGMALLDGAEYDLIVCDLHVPTIDGALDHDEEHGRVVLSTALDRHVGTPVAAFSGRADQGDLKRLIKRGRSADVLGEGSERQLVMFFDKTELVECVQLIREFAEGHAHLEGIQFSWGLRQPSLNRSESNVLRVYARRQGGVAVRLRQFDSGLSEAKVLSAIVEGPDQQVARVVAKIADRAVVGAEATKYSTLVGPVLGPGAAPAVVHVVDAGCGSRGGVFYQLVAEDPQSLVDVLVAGGSAAADAVEACAAALAPWRESVPLTKVSVGDVRRGVLADVKVVGEILEHQRLDLEAVEFYSRVCMQHCDLHVFNVLVDEHDRPIVIDFAEVDTASPALDPLTLELSLLFHPGCADIRGGWPTVEQAANWGDLEAYLVDCPVRDFVAACRKWASTASDQDCYAVLYAYSLKQLKYETADIDLIEALISAASRGLTGS